MSAATRSGADLAALDKDMLPKAAREHLCDLVTELSGIAKTLRAEINTVGDEDMYAAVSMWVDRIAQDLGAMECRKYPAGPVGGV